MSSWASWLLGRGASSGNQRDKARETIVELRQHLIMLEKKEDHLNKKIEDELRKAKANATTNKRAATAALRQKKLYEQELDRLAGRRMTLETQVNAIESANMNLDDASHASCNIDKVDATMDSIREQMDLTNEISDAISNPVGMGQELDEDEIKAELEELEQDELKSRLVGADSVPLHSPGQTERPVAARTVAQRQQEEDEDAELKELQAALAM
ncbi:hypothetical protein PSTT_10171 [Puccinia striiformis]|uniref:Vacuolar-sorting protein SNF7 n=1 Tax=Puccinia striiformis TaxID=27350 RepID=A0A2S4V5J3_9BASI|nr:hypothetical protein PSTT_10171 [Puccinia striiformis]